MKELKEDIESVKSLLDKLKVKYGDDFGCIIAIGGDIGGSKYLGTDALIGTHSMLHAACHALLMNSQFVEELFDTFECIIEHSSNGIPEDIKKGVLRAVNNMRFAFLSKTSDYKDNPLKLISELFKESKGN